MNNATEVWAMTGVIVLGVVAIVISLSVVIISVAAHGRADLAMTTCADTVIQNSTFVEPQSGSLTFGLDKKEPKPGPAITE